MGLNAVTVGLTVAAIQVMLMLAAGLGAFFAVLRRGVTFHVDLSNTRVDLVGSFDMSQVIPSPLEIKVLPTSPQEVAQPFVALPAEVLEYIDLESEEHARTDRRARARKLYLDSQDWKYVMRTLKREDGEVEQGEPST